MKLKPLPALSATLAMGAVIIAASAGSVSSLNEASFTVLSATANNACAGEPATAYSASMAGDNASGTISRGAQTANYSIATTQLVNHPNIVVTAVNSGDVGIEFRPQTQGLTANSSEQNARWSNKSADTAALTFDVSNLVGSGPARVRLRQTLDGGHTGGNSEASTYTVSWEGGGTAVVSDPVTTNDVYRFGAPTGFAAANGEIEGLATGDIIENGGSFVVYGTMNSKTQWHVDFPSGARNIKMNKVALSGATHAKGVITSPSDNPAMGRDVQLPRFGVSVNSVATLGSLDGAPGYTYQEFFAFQIFFTPEGANCLPPVATDNVTTTPFNTPVTFNVLADDTSNSGVALDPSLVRLLDAENNAVTQLTVAGEGVFTVDAVTGAITFTPVSGFTGKSSVNYRVTDSLGQTATAKYTVTVEKDVAPVVAPEKDVAPVVASAAEKVTKKTLPATGLNHTLVLLLMGAGLLVLGLGSRSTSKRLQSVR